MVVYSNVAVDRAIHKNKLNIYSVGVDKDVELANIQAEKRLAKLMGLKYDDKLIL